MKRYDRDIYVDYELEEECSCFTPGAEWRFGSEYHSVLVTYRIPRRMSERDNEDEINKYIDKHMGEEGFCR